jgi:hypothetical protein
MPRPPPRLPRASASWPPAEALLLGVSSAARPKRPSPARSARWRGGRPRSRLRCRSRMIVVGAEEPGERRADGIELAPLERPLVVLGRDAGGHEQPVPLPQRQLELFGEATVHGAAGRGAAGLEGGQEACRDRRRLGPQLLLAEVALLASGADQRTDRRRRRRDARHPVAAFRGGGRAAAPELWLRDGLTAWRCGGGAARPPLQGC